MTSDLIEKVARAEIKPEGFATLMVRNNLPSGRKVVCRVFIAEHYELNGQPMVRIVDDPELETIAQRIRQALEDRDIG